MKIKYLLPSVILTLALVGCGDNASEDEGGNGGGNTSVTGNDNANHVADATGYEVPALNSKYMFIAHKLDNGKMNYCLEYDLSKNHSYWVAYRYDSQSAKSAVSRTNAWAADPALNNYKESQIAPGYFPGYNRGHLVGSAERLSTTQANEQTFYMTNMSPMNGQFNSEYWGEVEDIVRDKWGRACAKNTTDTLYVVKGGTIDSRINGHLAVQNTLGKNIQTVIPKYFFIACLSIKSGKAKAIGFWMEHKDYGNTSASFKRELARKSAVSIDQLEQLTGIDFFCNLPDATEKLIESQCDLGAWPGLEATIAN